MKISKFGVGLMGLVLGVLANSINVETSKPFKFNNPIAFNTSEKDQKRIIENRPLMFDKEYSFDLFGLKIPFITHRTVQNPQSKTYSGILDENENIHSLEGIYELRSAHDSNWYVKKIED